MSLPVAGLFAQLRKRISAPPVKPRFAPEVCWGTKSQVRQFGLSGENTRPWAHAWVRQYMERLPLAEIKVVDAGAGASNPLLDWYRPQVRHAYLVEFKAEESSIGNTTVVNADLEKGIPLPDESVDVVTSVSSIEHLSAQGQLLFMEEAQRLLVPGGSLVMTISHVLGLNEAALAILGRDPALINRGCGISAPVNLKKMLAAAPKLTSPAENALRRFPGYEGFSESELSADSDIIFDDLVSFGNVRCLPETDAMALRWAEIGVCLVKKLP